MSKKKLGVCFGHEKKNTYHGIEGAFSGPWFSIMLNQSACFWDALKISDISAIESLNMMVQVPNVVARAK